MRNWFLCDPLRTFVELDPIYMMKKKYLKSKPVCKVNFTLPKGAASNANEVSVVGDFNNWDSQQHKMKKLKNGSFVSTIDLQVGAEYQFRYLIDDIEWENSWDADKYVPTVYGDSDNSVVVV